jgi:Predicted permeases
MSKSKARIENILAMVIYGTIGLFRKFIPYSSGIVALGRAFIGMLFLLLFMLITHKKFSFADIKKNLVPLSISGALLGFNWILLFESYRYTSVAKGTLCYYMAPVILIVLSPILFKEKLSVKKIICVVVALIGITMVSGVFEDKSSNGSELKGILFGLGAAVFYAAIVITNKRIHGISAYDKTVYQLFISVIVLIPYILLTDNLSAIEPTPFAIGMLVAAGILHTGIAYTLYFGSIEFLPTQDVALLSYIDPVVAILLSAFVLRESISPLGIIGAVLVIGALIFSETGE